MTEQEKYMYTAAIKVLKEHHDIGESFIAFTKFDDRPQHNEDGSVTHDIRVTIGATQYDVEVYEYKGDYTADCWGIGGTLI